MTKTQKGGLIMPRGDGTGPNSQGPLTGRGLGYCTGYVTPGYAQGSGRGLGLGLRRGFGGRFFRGAMPSGGRGWGGYNAWIDTPYGPMTQAPANPTPEEEKVFLKDQAKMMEEELKAIKQRLSEIK